jgi:preprotein translocase subunit SecG
VLNLVSIGVGWIFASQIWAKATLLDNAKTVSVSGVDAYPQLTFIFCIGLLMLWLMRYFNSVFTKFLANAVLALMLSTSLPVLFDSASSSLQILSPQISKVAGISDWLGQAELIKSSTYNNLAADVTVIALGIWFITSIALLWATKPGQTDKDFVTRIEKLPSW